MTSPFSPLWALGLMSGTSADGVDGALLYTDGIDIIETGPTHFIPYSPHLKKDILEAYGKPPGSHTMAVEDRINLHHVQVIEALRGKFKPPIDLIGFHGQTVYHKPPSKRGELGETHQIGDGQKLAILTGIPVVNQFRLNDMAHGGQGAPLVPLFHQALAKNLPKPLAFLNIGGVANLTWIGEKDDDLLAFDTGPGNGLIDDWVRHHSNLAWDEEGKIAAQGKANREILNQWLHHPYFSQKPPKSLDRHTFSNLAKDIASLSLEDGAATLTAFTAKSIGAAQKYFPQKPSLWIVSGGGAYNETLLKEIETTVAAPLHLASEKGWNSDAIEAQAFAYLAVRSLRGLTLTLPGTTGVSIPVTGGILHKANLIIDQSACDKIDSEN